ncbi:FKBP-type peptidyl-prolyl cis-trans isomerase [candidate division KSB1 bacterium]
MKTVSACSAVLLLLLAGCSDTGTMETTQSTASGIQYEIVNPGSDKKLEKGGVVSVHYTGTFLDGTQFDSSRDRNEPFKVIAGVGSVIPGWDEVLLMMGEGAQWNVTIPSELAYGTEGQGDIPPDTDLRFEIELLDIIDETFTTESGIQYTIIEEESGALPQAGQTAFVHYNLWTPDWILRDSSYRRGQPFTVRVGEGGVIDGWQQALSIMPMGSKWKVTIPSELAYGKEGIGPIGPDTDLIFEMFLIALQ